jgi:Uma2 family endonuclease
MATIARAPEQQVVLHNVAWETYERLLNDHVESSAPRFTYAHGELEILSPSTEHEKVNRTLALLVEIVAVELLIDVLSVGSMTFKRRDMQQGFEPDSSFYIQREEQVRDRTQIDLAVDPPPDLVIEIEIEMTRPAIAKFPLYAAMGVPEVWRCDGERVTIHHLAEGEYRVGHASAALPPLTSEGLTTFLQQSRKLRRTEWLLNVREWATTLR